MNRYRIVFQLKIIIISRVVLFFYSIQMKKKVSKVIILRATNLKRGQQVNLKLVQTIPSFLNFRCELDASRGVLKILATVPHLYLCLHEKI